MHNTMTDYSDIIHLPHVTVEGHPRMSLAQRAAQFAPFAALSTDEPEKQGNMEVN